MRKCVLFVVSVLMDTPCYPENRCHESYEQVVCIIRGVGTNLYFPIFWEAKLYLELVLLHIDGCSHLIIWNAILTKTCVYFLSTLVPPPGLFVRFKTCVSGIGSCITETSSMFAQWCLLGSRWIKPKGKLCYLLHDMLDNWYCIKETSSVFAQWCFQFLVDVPPASYWLHKEFTRNSDLPLQFGDKCSQKHEITNAAKVLIKMWFANWTLHIMFPGAQIDGMFEYIIRLSFR